MGPLTALLAVAFLVVPGTPAAPCPTPPKLVAPFWVVVDPPKFCVTEIEPWASAPGHAPELVVDVDPNTGLARARVRSTAPGTQPSDWSDPSEPFRVVRPGVTPDADGNGFVGTPDFTLFVADFRAGDARHFDFDGNGLMTSADFALGFLPLYNGQILR